MCKSRGVIVKEKSSNLTSRFAQRCGGAPCDISITFVVEWHRGAGARLLKRGPLLSPLPVCALGPSVARSPRSPAQRCRNVSCDQDRRTHCALPARNRWHKIAELFRARGNLPHNEISGESAGSERPPEASPWRRGPASRPEERSPLAVPAERAAYAHNNHPGRPGRVGSRLLEEEPPDGVRIPFSRPPPDLLRRGSGAAGLSTERRVAWRLRLPMTRAK